MTESTRLLNSAQAAARLGVKPATLYAYVSRGLLPRHRSPDGRTSLFDPADVARLERRSGARRGSPADIVIASGLTLVDTDAGCLWYRGLDPLAACRDRRFEEIAGWLWTGGFDAPRNWRADPRSLRAAKRAHAAGLQAMAASVAAARPNETGVAAATDLLSSLVDGLPGAGAPASATLAHRLWIKVTDRRPEKALVKIVDAALSLTCDHGLTYPAVVARLSAAAGAGIGPCVAAAMGAGAVAVAASHLEEIASAISRCAEDGAMRAADPMSRDSVVSATSGPYRSGDPRARVLLEMLNEQASEETTIAWSLAEELRRRGAGPPTVSFAQAAIAWCFGMPGRAAETVALISRAAGWIAHVLEEQRQPTPYRPRLAYTGPPPRSAPRKMLDAVQGYLARE